MLIKIHTFLSGFMVIEEILNGITLTSINS